MATETQAEGVIEAFVAERVAIAMWRLRRAERAELGILLRSLLQVESERANDFRDSCEIDAFEQLMVRETAVSDVAGHRKATAQLAEIESAQEDDLPTLGKALAKDAIGPASLDLLQRYRTAAERSLFRTLHELRDLRAARPRS